MFTPQERTAVFSLACILAFRMIGLFVIIPIFSPYLQGLENSTPLLIGLTMGIYGLTQAIFQIPFGILSDYIGRKEVITLGLIIFLLGCCIAGYSDNIWWTMLGRALQGAGAISGTTIALISDLTSEQSRTKAMAIIGVSIGAAFMLAFMLGPMLNSFLSVNNIFYLIGCLVLPILIILWFITPNVNKYTKQTVQTVTPAIEPGSGSVSILQLLNNKNIFKQLKVHNFGIFTLHGILMANFVALPILFKNFDLTNQRQAITYILVFFLSVLFMVPLLIISEKNQQQKNIMRFSVLLLVLSQVIFWFLNAKFWGIIVGLILFFTGFNILEASLPSIISKLAPKNSKGAAMGVYSTAQFLGPMLGGVLAGVIFKHYGLAYIFILGLLWSGLWLLKLLKDY